MLPAEVVEMAEAAAIRKSAEMADEAIAGVTQTRVPNVSRPGSAYPMAAPTAIAFPSLQFYNRTQVAPTLSSQSLSKRSLTATEVL